MILVSYVSSIIDDTFNPNTTLLERLLRVRIHRYFSELRCYIVYFSVYTSEIF